METLIKSSALASCEERMNLRAATVTARQGQSRAPGAPAQLDYAPWPQSFDESLPERRATRTESGNLLDRFRHSVKDPASPAFPVPGILGSGA